MLQKIPIMFREAVVMSVYPADRHPLWSHIDLLQSPFKDPNSFIYVIVDNCKVKKMTICLFQSIRFTSQFLEAAVEILKITNESINSKLFSELTIFEASTKNLNFPLFPTSTKSFKMILALGFLKPREVMFFLQKCKVMNVKLPRWP